MIEGISRMLNKLEILRKEASGNSNKIKDLRLKINRFKQLWNNALVNKNENNNTTKTRKKNFRSQLNSLNKSSIELKNARNRKRQGIVKTSSSPRRIHSSINNRPLQSRSTRQY